MAAKRNIRAYRQTNPAGTGFYVYGNAVRSTQAQPERMPQTRPGNYSRTRQSKTTGRTSRQVQKNRNRAFSISPAYAVFLVAAAFCAVLLCVMYLRLQADVVSRSENITALQEQLADLTEANDTAYHAAENSVDLQTVKEKAMKDMGMVYESEGTVLLYKSPTSDYVRQYDDIPEDGVLAKSKDISKQ